MARQWGERVCDGSVAADAFGQFDCAVSLAGPGRAFPGLDARTTVAP